MRLLVKLHLSTETARNFCYREFISSLNKTNKKKKQVDKKRLFEAAHTYAVAINVANEQG